MNRASISWLTCFEISLRMFIRQSMRLQSVYLSWRHASKVHSNSLSFYRNERKRKMHTQKMMVEKKAMRGISGVINLAIAAIWYCSSNKKEANLTETGYKESPWKIKQKILFFIAVYLHTLCCLRNKLLAITFFRCRLSASLLTSARGVIVQKCK